MELTWAPAAIGLIGGSMTYVMAWREGRRNEKRFLAADAVNALTALMNQTNAEMERVKDREQDCQRRLTTMNEEGARDRDEIARLHNRVYELEKRLGIGG